MRTFICAVGFDDWLEFEKRLADLLLRLAQAGIRAGSNRTTSLQIVFERHQHEVEGRPSGSRYQPTLYDVTLRGGLKALTRTIGDADKWAPNQPPPIECMWWFLPTGLKEQGLVELITYRLRSALALIGWHVEVGTTDDGHDGKWFVWNLSTPLPLA